MISEDLYYQKIKKLNISHYTSEVPYYSNASLRKVEKVLLQNINSSSRILDVACGAGRFSIPAALKGHKIIGIDITLAAIQAAIKKAEELKISNIKFIVTDATNLPFKDNSFDYVFCPRFSINGIATYKYRRLAVKEMFRVVKPTGILFIESFNKLYLGRGLFLPIKNILIDFWRYLLIIFSKIIRKDYNGLLPGDIIYRANKIKGAPRGYTHLPTIWELKSLFRHNAPNAKIQFYSISEIINKQFDIWKFFRYSMWALIQKGV